MWYADGTDKFFVARSEAEAFEKAKAELGEDVKLTQDDDVSIPRTPSPTRAHKQPAAFVKLVLCVLS